MGKAKQSEFMVGALTSMVKKAATDDARVHLREKVLQLWYTNKAKLVEDVKDTHMALIAIIDDNHSPEFTAAYNVVLAGKKSTFVDAVNGSVLGTNVSAYSQKNLQKVVEDDASDKITTMTADINRGTWKDAKPFIKKARETITNSSRQ